MGLISGIFSALVRSFTGRPATQLQRDISALHGESADLDVVTENIAPEGSPLKENGRRKVTHDKRLLPKKPPEGWGPRKRVMDATEASRLFSASLRSSNRDVVHIAVDTKQLQRLGLPVWKSEQELANALGLSVGVLRHYSMHRPADRICHYVQFAIPKKSGGQRIIHAPKKKLKEIQRVLNRELVSLLPQSEAAHAFRKDRSVLTNAEPHVGKNIVIKLDLKDFFPTITLQRVRGYLVAAGYSYPVAATLALLMTEAERQPVDVDGEMHYVATGSRCCVQGAPTSPGICNAITAKMDRRLTGLARSYNLGYTRYADDLTFSGDINSSSIKKLLSLVYLIVKEEGFEINNKKTRVLRKGGRQRVAGVIVNETLGLSRQDRRKLRAAIYQAKQADPDGSDTARWSKLRGKIAYLNMLNSEQAAKLIALAPDQLSSKAADSE
jgi:hypothetical protein